MGSVFSPKKPDTSEQDALVAKQQKQLEDQEKQAQLEADRERDKRVASQRAARNRRLGRSSLIGTGSELGTSGSLG
jgi:hypothetical protein